MAVTAKMYGKAMIAAFSKEIDFLNDTIKVMLLNNSYVPDQDAHDYFNDVSAYEVSGTGYTAGGITLTNKSVTYDPAANVIKIDADDVVWSSITVTARYAVIYDDTPPAADAKPLLGYVDFGQDMSPYNGEFKIIWNAEGIFKITVA